MTPTTGMPHGGATSRRTLLRAAGALGGVVVLSAAAGAPPAAAAGARTRVYVLVTDGCRPDEVTADLTPNLYALRRGWHVVPERPFAAGDGDHPQPRDDDDRRAPGPQRRAGQRASSTGSKEPCATSTADTDLHFPTVIERLNAAGYAPARCCRRSTSTGSSAPARPTAGNPRR